MSNYRDSVENRGSHQQRNYPLARFSENACTYNSENYASRFGKTGEQFQIQDAGLAPKSDGKFSKTHLLSRKLESIENLVKELNFGRNKEGNKENEMRLAN